MTDHPLAFVVEDDQDIAEIYSIALRTVGFEVEIIDNGARALARLAEAAPALVVLDLSMPVVAGDSVLRQFAVDHRLLNTRVMLVTAMAGKADEFAERADVTLIKPVSLSQIREAALRLVPSARLKQDHRMPKADPSPNAKESDKQSG